MSLLAVFHSRHAAAAVSVHAWHGCMGNWAWLNLLESVNSRQQRNIYTHTHSWSQDAWQRLQMMIGS